MIADYPWGRFYEAAILETDRSKLAKHIQVAEETISSRVRELNGNRDASEEERSAIRDALSGLRILRDEVWRAVPEGALEVRFRDLETRFQELPAWEAGFLVLEPRFLTLELLTR